jgi:sugar phosphate isomerase/epimerase
MASRRTFLHYTPAFAAVTFVPGLIGSSEAPRAKRIHIGAQTNTWGVPIKPFDRLLEVVETLGKLGYEGFETSSSCLDPVRDRPAMARREFESRHCQLISAHAGGPLFNKEMADDTLEKSRRIAGYTAAMGASYFIASGPRLPHMGDKLDLTAVHNTTEGLNRLGEIVKKEGLKLCYHNHRQEFADDPSEMSFILKDTDPELVWLNYDVGGAYPIGPNPGEFSAEHFERIAVYHIKNVTLDAGGKQTPTDLDAGKIDLKSVVRPLLHSAWSGWLTVERESLYPHPADHPAERQRRCREYLRSITGI